MSIGSRRATPPTAKKGVFQERLVHTAPDYATEATQAADLCAHTDPSAPLWLAIYFSDLPLAVFTREPTRVEPDQPCAVCQEDGTNALIICSNDAALRHDIVPGISLRAAHSLTTSLQLFYRNTIAEHAILERLAVWAGRYTSKVVVTETQTLLLEIGGSLRLFHGVNSLLKRVDNELTALGYKHQRALSITPSSAELLARTQSGTQVLNAAHLTSAIGAAPIDALNLDKRHTKLLHGVGAHYLRDLLRLPREGLARRTAPHILHTLDRLLGHRPDPQCFYSPPRTYKGQLEFSDPIDNTDRLLPATQHLIIELTAALRTACSGVDTLTWTLQHHALPDTVMVLPLLAPNRDDQHLQELMRERLERFALPAPVDAIVLTTGLFQPLPGNAMDAFADIALQEYTRQTALLERLQTRLDSSSVIGMCLHDEHRPEKAWRYCTPGGTGPTLQCDARPLWLLSPARPISTRDGQPYLHGRLTLSTECERIETGWWDRNRIGRDYFSASTVNGVRLWIYRELKPPRRWFLHGYF